MVCRLSSGRFGLCLRFSCSDPFLEEFADSGEELGVGVVYFDSVVVVVEFVDDDGAGVEYGVGSECSLDVSEPFDGYVDGGAFDPVAVEDFCAGVFCS